MENSNTELIKALEAFNHSLVDDYNKHKSIGFNRIRLKTFRNDVLDEYAISDYTKQNIKNLNLILTHINDLANELKVHI